MKKIPHFQTGQIQKGEAHMKKSVDFLMIHPHDEIQAYSQRVLLGILKNAGYSVHLLIVSSIKGIQNNKKLYDAFLNIIENSKIVGFGFMSNNGFVEK